MFRRDFLKTASVTCCLPLLPLKSKTDTPFATKMIKYKIISIQFSIKTGVFGLLFEDINRSISHIETVSHKFTTIVHPQFYNKQRLLTDKPKDLPSWYSYENSKKCSPINIKIKYKDINGLINVDMYQGYHLHISGKNTGNITNSTCSKLINNRLYMACPHIINQTSSVKPFNLSSNYMGYAISLYKGLNTQF